MSERDAPEWRSWGNDPLIQAAGITFDRTPAGKIKAPAGRFRVCAYHIDFDERPTCYIDVATRTEAINLCDNLAERCSWNVDYALVFDEHGARIHGEAYG